MFDVAIRLGQFSWRYTQGLGIGSVFERLLPRSPSDRFLRAKCDSLRQCIDCRVSFGQGKGYQTRINQVLRVFYEASLRR